MDGIKDRQPLLPSNGLQDPLFDHSNKHQKSVKNHHNDSRGFHRSTAPPNYNTRQKQQSNWQRGYGENRMQAFFLISPGSTTSGTGVFLPATGLRPPTKKPACSPVLLPARVVQTLDLNIHNNVGENDSKKKSEMVATAMENEVETPNDSPEKLLPEEWIY